MSTDMLRKVLSDVVPFGDEFTFHIMGEPTAHPEFAKMVSIAGEFNAPLTLTTNGTLVYRQAIADALLHPTVRQVNFSLQSWTSNFGYEKLGGYLEKVLAFVARAERERPDLYVNLRLWNFGSDEETQLHNAHFLGPLSKAFGVPLEGVRPDVRTRKSHKIRNRLYLHFDSRFEWPSRKDPVRSKIGFCYALKNQIGVLADGTVVPCCLDKEGQVPVGNLTTHTFQEVLDSERAVSLKKAFDSYQLTEDLCQKCTYISRFDSKLGFLKPDYHERVSF